MISSCRSTAERSKSFCAYSSRVFPLVKAITRFPASPTSQSNFAVSRRIQCEARRVYRLTEIRIANGARRDEIDTPAEEFFQRVAQVEPCVDIRAIRAGIEFNQDINITAHLVKGAAGSRPENVEPVNEILAAQGRKAFATRGVEIQIHWSDSQKVADRDLPGSSVAHNCPSECRDFGRRKATGTRCIPTSRRSAHRE